MIKFLNLGSGSKGNASLIYNDKTLILLDAGLSKKAIVKGLAAIDKTIEDIDLVLLTHDHIDHILSVEIFNSDIVKSTFLEKKSAKLEYFSKYLIKDIEYIPLKTSHDAPNPCGYLFSSNNEELVYITDTGIISFETLAYIKNKDYYVIESNHDVKMLLESDRPIFLKERILSSHGHLSNEQCAYYLLEIIGKKTKKVCLAHLSEECNRPDIALKTIDDYFIKNNAKFDKVEIVCLSQYEATLL